MSDIALIVSAIGRFMEHAFMNYPAVTLGSIAVIYLLTAISRFRKPRS